MDALRKSRCCTKENMGRKGGKELGPEGKGGGAEKGAKQRSHQVMSGYHSQREELACHWLQYKEAALQCPQLSAADKGKAEVQLKRCGRTLLAKTKRTSLFWSALEDLQSVQAPQKRLWLLPQSQYNPQPM